MKHIIMILALLATFAPAIEAKDISIKHLQIAANTESNEVPRLATQHLRIEFHVKASAEAEFNAIMSSINTLMANEEGFISADVFRHKDNNLHFTLIEKWVSYEAHQKHYDIINANGDWEHILQMLECEPQLIYMMEVK